MINLYIKDVDKELRSMASQNIKHKRSSQSVGFYLAGSVLLMLLFQV